MKVKTLALSLLLLVPGVASATGIVSPDSGNTIDFTVTAPDTINYEAACGALDPSPCYVGYIFGPGTGGAYFYGGGGEPYGGANLADWASGNTSSPSLSGSNSPDPDLEGDYHVYLIDDNSNGGAGEGGVDAACNYTGGAGSATGETDCLAFITGNGMTYTSGTFTYPAPAEEVSNPFSGLIDTADSGFTNTTGFSMAAGVGFASDNVIKLFIGSAMSVLYYLRYWILALIIISSIIYFSFRAMVFFRH